MTNSEPLKRQTAKGDLIVNPLQVKWHNIPPLICATLRADRRYSKKHSRGVVTKGQVKWQNLLRPGLRLMPKWDCKPVFVIGAPRSGTTFFGECLAKLPEISYHYEPIATKRFSRLVYERIWGFHRAKLTYWLVYALLFSARLKPNAYFCEKTPRNSLIVHFLSCAFPRSRFIHIIRDGRDCAISLSRGPWYQAKMAFSGKRGPSGYLYGPFARFWAEPHRRKEFEETSDIHRSIWCWRAHNEAALTATKNLQVGRYIQIRYEDFFYEPKATAKRVLDFLQIAEPQSYVAFYTAISGAFGYSIGRWKTQLSYEQLEVVYKEAGPLLRRLTYWDGT